MPRTVSSGAGRLLPGLAMLAVGGCATGAMPLPKPADLALPERFAGAPSAPAAADISYWWGQYNDPVLSELVSRAVDGNQDAAHAEALVRQAREGVVQARSGYWPSLSTSFGASRSDRTGAPTTDALSERVDGQWTIDLFGGTRGAVSASKAQLEAAQFRLDDRHAVIAADVARAYIDYRTAETRIAIADGLLAAQTENLEIARFRLQAGLVSALDVEQAVSQQAATAAGIPLLQRQAAQARFRLATLTAAAPADIDALVARPGGIPATPEGVSAGAPVDLLRRRPDVRAAEQSLLAAAANVGVAASRLYPSLTLSGSLSSSGAGVSDLGDIVTSSLQASVLQPVFQGGALRSQVRERKAAAEEALAAYRSAVLRAIEDVEAALKADATARARARLLAVQAAAADGAARLARENYRAGLTDFQRLLDAERTLLSARDSLAAAEGDVASASVQLFEALGGGWTPRADHEGSSDVPD